MKNIIHLIFRQSLMDFRKRNLGTLLGGVWAIISPLITITLIYFVFTFGLKATIVGNISFVYWLIPGMLLWFFISETLTLGCTSITENSHLVTKIVFPVFILPISKSLSSLPVHFCLMGLFLIILLYEGVGTIYTWWQIAYYLFCSIIFCTSISYITSSSMVFIRDTGNILSVVVQIFFWATPIFWNPSMLENTKFRIILLSPFNYLIQGYRDALFNGINFWNKPNETLTFWLITLCLGGCAMWIFRKTRPHFADVL